MTAEDQLREELGSLIHAWGALLGLDLIDVVSDRVESRVPWLIGQLRDGEGALDILCVLHPDVVPDEWWRTPLGRLVAQAGGAGGGSVTQAQAARMLGVSRPRVSALVADGKLPVDETGRVMLSGVGQRLSHLSTHVAEAP